MNQNQSFRREQLAMADGTFGWRGLGEVRMMDAADHLAPNFTNRGLSFDRAPTPPPPTLLTTSSTISLCTGEMSTAKRVVISARNGDHTEYHQDPKAC